MSQAIGPRAAAACAFVFTLCLFAGVASIDVPRSASDQEMVEWWTKDSNQNAAVASMYFVAIAAIAFIPFVAHLRDRLNSAQQALGNVVFGFGIVFAGLLLASAATRGVIGSAVNLNDEPLPGVDALRYFPQLAFSFMNMALIAIGVGLLVTSWAVLRNGSLAGWFGWVSAGAGAALVIGTPVIGPLTLPVLWVWSLTAGVAVWAPSGRTVLRTAGAASGILVAVAAFASAVPTADAASGDSKTSQSMSRAEFVEFDLGRDNEGHSAVVKPHQGMSRAQFIDFDLAERSYAQR